MGREDGSTRQESKRREKRRRLATRGFSSLEGCVQEGNNNQGPRGRTDRRTDGVTAAGKRVPLLLRDSVHVCAVWERLSGQRRGEQRAGDFLRVKGTERDRRAGSREEKLALPREEHEQVGRRRPRRRLLLPLLDSVGELSAGDAQRARKVCVRCSPAAAESGLSSLRAREGPREEKREAAVAVTHERSEDTKTTRDSPRTRRSGLSCRVIISETGSSSSRMCRG